MRDFIIYGLVSILLWLTFLLVAGFTHPSFGISFLFFALLALTRHKPIYAVCFSILLLFLFLSYDLVKVTLTELERHQPSKYPAANHFITLGVIISFGALVLSPVSYALGKLAAFLWDTAATSWRRSRRKIG